MFQMQMQVHSPPGADTLGPDDRIEYYANGDLRPPTWPTPANMEPAGPWAIVALCPPPAQPVLWARAYRLTADEQDRRYKEREQARRDEEARQRDAEEAAAESVLEALWDGDGEWPGLDSTPYKALRKMATAAQLRPGAANTHGLRSTLWHWALREVREGE